MPNKKIAAGCVLGLMPSAIAVIIYLFARSEPIVSDRDITGSTTVPAIVVDNPSEKQIVSPLPERNEPLEHAAKSIVEPTATPDDRIVYVGDRGDNRERAVAAGAIIPENNK